MAEKTPENFEFWVKIPGEATHGDGDFTGAVRQFLSVIQPLREAGKLCGFLAQFPQSFHRNGMNLDRVEKLHSTVGSDGMLAVEFRHDGWIADETFEFFERHGVVYVAVDLPTLPGLPGAVIRSTAPVSYIRLHGRNSRAWHNPKLGDRYDYEYTVDELKEWLPRIQQLDERRSSTYIFFNNCHAGQAVKNARMLRQLLESELENQTLEFSAR